ncbi:MAG: leucyl/phenylalanyl-tRNA--protein transferase [Actinomycetes bacterium]
MPVEPEPSRWEFPSVDDDSTGPHDDLVAIGGDLEAGTLLEAYRSGVFPMPVGGRRAELGWWSPEPRAILPTDGLIVSRSLRRSLRRFDVRVDTAFTAVVEACGATDRAHGWITGEFVEAYTRLHQMGWAHSVETWTDEGELVGGLYGVSIGSFFAGESMFHTATDASKVALVHLVDLLRPHDDALLDVQWSTDHLRTLGVVEIPRSEYLLRLHRATSRPPVDFRV